MYFVIQVNGMPHATAEEALRRIISRCGGNVATSQPSGGSYVVQVEGPISIGAFRSFLTDARAKFTEMAELPKASSAGGPVEQAYAYALRTLVDSLVRPQR